MRKLGEAWKDRRTKVVIIRSWGGTGKTSLVRNWFTAMQDDRFRGAERVFAWSFDPRLSEHQEGPADAPDEFFGKALSWFTEADSKQIKLEESPWARGDQLAHLACKHRTLLILDGIESLQDHPDSEKGGHLEEGLYRLVIGMARGWGSGLCLITSRYPVTGLESFPANSVMEINLKNLSRSQGVELLKAYRVRGTARELGSASEQVNGHCLALNLLGRYLGTVGGDIRRAIEVWEEEPEEPTEKVLSAYARSFGEHSPEVGILRVAGLFDGPFGFDCLEPLLQRSAIAGSFAPRVLRRALVEIRGGGTSLP